MGHSGSSPLLFITPHPAPWAPQSSVEDREAEARASLESDMGVGRARWGEERERRTNIERELRGQQEAVGAEKEASYTLSLPPAHPSHLSYVKSLSLEEGAPDRVERRAACSPLRCQGVDQPGLSSGGGTARTPLCTPQCSKKGPCWDLCSVTAQPSCPHPTSTPGSCMWPRTLVSSLPCRPASPLSSPLGPRLCPHWLLSPDH